MRTFEHFNANGKPCPLCGTREDKPPVLVAIAGTEDDGICEALQVHLDCIDLTAYRKYGKIVFEMVAAERLEPVSNP